MPEDNLAARKELEARQLALLNGLLKEVSATNAFYRNKLGDDRNLFSFESLEAFRSRFPFTEKSEWGGDQENHPPYGTNLTYPLDRYIRCHQTSGTSGKPMRWLDTRESWNGLLDDWRQVYRAAELGREDRFFFAFSFGPFLGFWTAFEAALRQGSFCLSGGSMTTEVRLQAMKDNHITALVCTPTYALRLGETANEQGFDRQGSSLRKLVVAGEPGGSLASVRQCLAELWPTATVFDHHGMTETGPVSFQCPASPGMLHIIDTSYLAEIVDPETNQAVDYGEKGELILTTLRRAGSPLIRYRTGDLVERALPGSCGCGREETILAGGIIGRCDDMVVVRGVNVYPSAVDEIVRHAGGVIEYQVQMGTNRSLVELSVNIETAANEPDPSIIVRNVESELRRRLGLRIPVRSVPTNSLPRFEMKARRWVRSQG